MHTPVRVSRWARAVSFALCVIATALVEGAEVPAPRVALKGYDTVAYFTEGRPVKGAPGFHHDWDGARYHFASAQSRDAFAADPDRYAPQFSGLCAASLSKGKIVDADPTLWKIVGDKLYVFGAAAGLAMAERDPSLLQRSNENWRSQR